MPDPAAPNEYVERLTPGPGVWFAALSVAASSGLVALTAFGQGAAIAVAACGVLLTGWALARTSAVIRVGSGQLAAGRARIAVSLLGAVRELDAAQMAALRGPRADARAYLCQRGWIRTGLAVQIADPMDPTPYWLLSSRHPADATRALRAEIARSNGPASAGQEHSRQTS